MKKLIALLLIAVLALTCFAACGKKDDGKAAADPVGMYVVKTFNGKTIEEYLKDYVAAQGGEQAAALVESLDLDTLLQVAGIESVDDFISMELKADGTATITMTGETETGTWTQDGSKVTVTIDDDPVEFTQNGNELSAEKDDMSMVFVKK